MSDTIHSCSPFCTLPACIKERQRRDFEAWMLHTEKIIVGSSDPYPAGLERERWRVWQAATERATPKWLSIETAPRDRTSILVLNKHLIFEAWYSKKWDRFIVSETGGTNSINPTHWMPLPPPPAIRQGSDT